MLKKLKLVSIFLCVLLLSTACTDKSKQSDADKSSSTVQENSTDTAIGSIKNTYWLCKDDSVGWERTVELFFNEDGSFHCRSIVPEADGYEDYYVHIDAESCTWNQNADMVELEFHKVNPHKKEVFYAQILNKGDKMRCPDMFEVTDDNIVFVKQDKMPKITSIEEDSPKLVGEWEVVSVGGHIPNTINADDGKTFESSINIYEIKDKLYADYHIIRQTDNGRNNLEQIGLTLNNEELYTGIANEFWSANFDEPVIPEGASTKKKLNIKLTLVDDNKLILIEENPEDEYTDPTPLVYLRKGSKEYDDRENYFYHNIITVSNIDELAESLKSNTKIILKEGTYNFSDLNEDETSEYEDIQKENILMYTDHLRLEAEPGANVSILINSASDNVLEFYGGSNISLKGLTIGHNVEKGSCTGNVLYFSAVDGVNIEDCNLFGCGTYGISSYLTSNINVINTQIYECTYGLLELESTDNMLFKNCVLRDSQGFEQFIMNYCNNIKFEDCKITGNKVDYGDIFISNTDSHGIVFENCSFKDNTYKEKNSDGIEFTDCTFDDNK